MDTRTLFAIFSLVVAGVGFVLVRSLFNKKATK